MRNEKVYEYDAVIQYSTIDSGGAYVPFPYDVRTEFNIEFCTSGY